MDIFRFFPGYTTLIYDTGREPAFVMLLSFIVTFVITRGYTRLARITGWGSTSFGGVHTHHLVFGVVLSFVAGAVMFGFLPDPGWFLLLLAAAFGAGAALVLDEFALIFHLQDVYWEKEGRKSIDAVVLGVALGCMFLLHVVPLGAGDATGWELVGAMMLNLLWVIIAGLKGKLTVALFGLFIPIIAIIGAIRVAEPDSLWARRFYRHRPKKMQQSREYHARFEKQWRHRKEKLWDIVGGKPERHPKLRAKAAKSVKP